MSKDQIIKFINDVREANVIDDKTKVQELIKNYFKGEEKKEDAIKLIADVSNVDTAKLTEKEKLRNI